MTEMNSKVESSASVPFYNSIAFSQRANPSEKQAVNNVTIDLIASDTQYNRMQTSSSQDEQVSKSESQFCIQSNKQWKQQCNERQINHSAMSETQTIFTEGTMNDLWARFRYLENKLGEKCDAKDLIHTFELAFANALFSIKQQHQAQVEALRAQVGTYSSKLKSLQSQIQSFIQTTKTLRPSVSTNDNWSQTNDDQIIMINKDVSSPSRLVYAEIEQQKLLWWEKIHLMLEEFNEGQSQSKEFRTVTNLNEMKQSLQLYEQQYSSTINMNDDRDSVRKFGKAIATTVQRIIDELPSSLQSIWQDVTPNLLSFSQKWCAETNAIISNAIYQTESQLTLPKIAQKLWLMIIRLIEIIRFQTHTQIKSASLSQGKDEIKSKVRDQTFASWRSQKIDICPVSHRNAKANQSQLTNLAQLEGKLKTENWLTQQPSRQDNEIQKSLNDKNVENSKSGTERKRYQLEDFLLDQSQEGKLSSAYIPTIYDNVESKINSTMSPLDCYRGIDNHQRSYQINRLVKQSQHIRNKIQGGRNGVTRSALGNQMQMADDSNDVRAHPSSQPKPQSPYWPRTE